MEDLLLSETSSEEFINSNLSNDIDTLKKHYVILLDYIKTLETKNNEKSKMVYSLNNKVELLEKYLENDDLESTYINKLLKELKHERCARAGLESQYQKEKRRRVDSELLLKKSLDEVAKLKEFERKVIDVLNNF